MAYKNRPTKTVFKKGGAVLTDAEKRIKQGVLDDKISKARLFEAKLAQLEIDKYNNVDLYKIDSFFKKIQLHGPWLIVRLKQENLIKYINEDNPDNPIIDAWVRQIDGRQRTTDQPYWVPTPFPFVEEGIVVAVAPEVQKHYYELQDELKKYNPELAKTIVIPEVGDTVHIRANTSQWYKDHRYYIDKQEQCMDFVRNQTELRLNKFEFYFRLEDFELENIYNNGSRSKCFYDDNDQPVWYEQELNKYQEEINQLTEKVTMLTDEAKNELQQIVDESFDKLTDNKVN